MGYAFMTGPCVVCGSIFSFNPVRVPSVRDSNGERQQVCRSCVESANHIRKERGLEPFPIFPDAYEACDETELP